MLKASVSVGMERSITWTEVDNQLSQVKFYLQISPIPEGLDKVGSNSYKISNNAGELDGGIAIIFSCQEKAGLATYLPVRLKCPMSTFQKNSRRWLQLNVDFKRIHVSLQQVMRFYKNSLTWNDKGGNGAGLFQPRT